MVGKNTGSGHDGEQVAEDERLTEAPLADGDASEDEFDDEEEAAPAPTPALSGEAGARAKGPSRQTLAREDRRRRSQSRRTRRRLFYGVGGGVIALALITGLVLPSVGHLGFGGSTAANPVQTVPDAGTEIPVQEGTVITVGAEHAAYSTSPPTSGPRYAEAVEWGVYDEQIADETVVRNLEQGAVVFNYSLSDEEAVANLQEFVEALPGYPGCYVMQPHAAVTDGSVTVTSWGWTESYTGIDRFGMQQFVASHRNDAPRFVGATCGADTTIEASTSVSHDGT